MHPKVARRFDDEDTIPYRFDLDGESEEEDGGDTGGVDSSSARYKGSIAVGNVFVWARFYAIKAIPEFYFSVLIIWKMLVLRLVKP